MQIDRVCFATLVLIVNACRVIAFPDGAPVDACVKERPNQPYHAQNRPQPIETNPYQVLASSDHYGPGTEIQVVISGEIFKGFFLQARNAATNEWIGEWIKSPNTNIHPECSAITHADPKDKQQAILIWKAPLNTAPGQVYFTGTVLKSYTTFWSNLVANVLPSQ